MAALAGDRPGRRAAGAHGRGALRQRGGARSAARPAELTWKAGVDVLSFGGTKNGCLGVEAVMLFDPARAWEFELRRKRGGHLFSKHRFLAAQMEAYLADDLWLDLAARGERPGARLWRRASRRCRGRGWCIRPRPTRSSPPGRGPAPGGAGGGGATTTSGRPARAWRGRRRSRCSARLVCNWATTPAEVAQLLGLLGGAAVAEARRGAGFRGRFGAVSIRTMLTRMPASRGGGSRPRRVAEMRVEQRQAVLAPEDLLADDVARRAEDDAAQRLVGVALQRLDGGQQALVGEAGSKPARQDVAHHLVLGDVALLGPDRAQEAVDEPAEIAAARACAVMIAAEAGTGLVGKWRGCRLTGRPLAPRDAGDVLQPVFLPRDGCRSLTGGVPTSAKIRMSCTGL